MDPIDFPAELLRQAITVAWTMESNHGVIESSFNGGSQVQRGQIERWSFVMDFRPINRRLAQIMVGFFLRLEGRLGTFRMSDPASPAPLGPAAGNPVVAVDHAARARTVATSGWAANCDAVLVAGDWVQIGDQLCRLRADAPSDAGGNATLDIWPKLMIPMAGGTAVITRPAVGIFRFTSDLPSYDVSSGVWKNHSFKLTGSQEVLQSAG